MHGQPAEVRRAARLRGGARRRAQMGRQLTGPQLLDLMMDEAQLPVADSRRRHIVDRRLNVTRSHATVVARRSSLGRALPCCGAPGPLDGGSGFRHAPARIGTEGRPRVREPARYEPSRPRRVRRLGACGHSEIKVSAWRDVVAHCSCALSRRAPVVPRAAARSSPSHRPHPRRQFCRACLMQPRVIWRPAPRLRD